MGNFVETGQGELMLEYKGFKISGSSTPMYMEGCEVAWLSVQARQQWFSD
jgi:hypothetical protein